MAKYPRIHASRDPNVHIFPRSSITWVARMLMTPCVVVLLMAPVVICNLVGSLTARLVVIITATTGFVAVLSGVKRARTIELVVAATTWDHLYSTMSGKTTPDCYHNYSYTTVLIVFISNTNISGN